MTFRSFSRFVRWYRWPILATVVFAALCLHWVALVFFAPAFVPSVLLLALVDRGCCRAERVLARHRSILRERAIADKCRQRLMPLRGWTK